MTNIPTDNLYKFIAIFGLVILLTSVYYPFQMMQELSFKVYEIEAKAELMEYKNKYLEGRIKYITKRLENESDIEVQQKIYDDYYKQEIELKEAILSVKENTKKAELLLKNIETYEILRKYGTLVGAFLIFLGFLNWFRFLQNPLDKQIENSIATNNTQKNLTNRLSTRFARDAKKRRAP